jgi:tetratricopeptide (TPR) repeat protein
MKGKLMSLLTDKRKRLRVVVVITALALLAFGGSEFLGRIQSQQVVYYNQGLALLKAGDPTAAVKAFEQSLVAYNAERNHTPNLPERLFVPGPSREIAAQAAGYEGVALFLLKQPQAAVRAYRASLCLNPGDQTFGLSQADAQRLQHEAEIVQSNLELLYRTYPELAPHQEPAPQQ